MSLRVDIRKRLAAFDLDVSFRTDDASEILALLGASGCGKSMTLKCIAGIVTPDEGSIVLNGRVLFDSAAHVNLPPQKRRVGYLFQSYALFPNMTVEQNVMTALGEGTREQRRLRAREHLRAMRLEGLAGRRPAQLSGGQQQRCAMARIFASEPELLLLDEPFSALDGYLRWQLELELADTLGSFPGGTVYVSHNRDEVYRLCDSVCVLSEGKSDPKISMAELFAEPATLGAALISGCKNISKAHLEPDGRLACEDWGVTLDCGGRAAPETTHVGIRAHYFEVGPGPNAIRCVIDRVIDSTFSTIVMLRTPGEGLLRFELGKDAWRALGNPHDLTLHIDPGQVLPLADRPPLGSRGGSDA